MNTRTYEELYEEWKLQMPSNVAEYERTMERVQVIDRLIRELKGDLK